MGLLTRIVVALRSAATPGATFDQAMAMIPRSKDGRFVRVNMSLYDDCGREHIVDATARATAVHWVPNSGGRSGSSIKVSDLYAVNPRLCAKRSLRVRYPD